MVGDPRINPVTCGDLVEAYIGLLRLFETRCEYGIDFRPYSRVLYDLLRIPLPPEVAARE